MATEQEHSGSSASYYAVLGVRKDASPGEIRSAYRKLAMKWHPDRWGREASWLVEEAKRRFQHIQEAYQVLSDHRKRTLYDAGFYDPLEDDEVDEVEGFQEFVQEMRTLMAGVRREDYSLEELQRMLAEMAQDFDHAACTSHWFDTRGGARSYKRFRCEKGSTGMGKSCTNVAGLSVLGTPGFH